MWFFKIYFSLIHLYVLALWVYFITSVKTSTVLLHEGWRVSQLHRFETRLVRTAQIIRNIFSFNQECQITSSKYRIISEKQNTARIQLVIKNGLNFEKQLSSPLLKIQWKNLQSNTQKSNFCSSRPKENMTRKKETKHIHTGS